jgi:hypothetical protein
MFGVSSRGALALLVACCWAACSAAYVMSVDMGSEYMKVSLVQPGKAFEVSFWQLFPGALTAEFDSHVC